MAAATRPEPYRPRTYQAWQEQLTEALAEHIEANGITASDIAKRYRTVRDGHLKALRLGAFCRGDEHLHGLRMLLSIAEATGLPVELKIGKTQ